MTSFEIDLFGHVRSLTHAAYQQYLQQSEARRSTQLSLIAQVAQGYLALLSDRELLQLAQDTLKSQQASYDITVKEHDSGQVSGLDVAQAQSTVEQARADLARYEGNIAQDIDALNLLVGAPVDAASLPAALDDKMIGVRRTAARSALDRAAAAARRAAGRARAAAPPMPTSARRARPSSRPSV